MNIPENVTVVSFDIFDTLVHRRLAAPVDIFSTVRNKLCNTNEALFYGDLVNEFPQLRMRAEQKARIARIKSHGGEAEVNLTEIYTEFQNITSCDEIILNLLKKTELEMELLLIYRSAEGYKIYQAAKNLGKKVIYISDMYLHATFIQTMMQNLGYQDCDEQSLFVSSEIRKNKHTGSLYKYVAQKLNISPLNWLHIGDNEHSDVLEAKKFGILTHHAHWAKIKNVASKHSDMGDYLANSIISAAAQSHHNYDHNADELQLQGYKVFGPLIFGFYIWLVNEFIKYKPEKILFFARDCQFIIKIHELALLHFPSLQKIPYEYVYLSRKTLHHMGLSEISRARFWYYLPGAVAGTMDSVLGNLGIDPNKHLGVLQSENSEPNTKVTRANLQPAIGVISKLYKNLLDSGLAARKKHQSYFTNLISDASRVAIVDIGWNGNMQNSFVRSLLAEQRANKEFKGFYLGTLENSQLNISRYCKMAGWLVNKGEPKRLRKAIYRGGIELLEFCLTADHGTTLGYKTNSQGVTTPVLEEKIAAEVEYEKAALRLQQGMFDFVKTNLYLLESFPVESLISDTWYKPFLKLTNNPSISQIEAFGDLTHTDTAGKNNIRLGLAPQLPLWDCISKNKNYEKGLKKAFWKSAFTKRNSRKRALFRLFKK